jgi:hypothetical protein
VKRTRLVVDVTPELRRRIRVAAAERDESVRDYVVGILERTVPRKEENDGAEGTPVTTEMIERLRRTRESIMRGRVFTDDSTDLINAAREERTAELEP